MIRILHLADLHLGWKPSFLSGEKQLTRQRERDNTLKKAVEFAINPLNNIDMVIIAGDLFETHKPEDALARDVIMELKKLETRGIYIITVPGNHDEISYHDSVYRKNASHWPGLLVKNPMPALAAATEIKGIPIWIYSMAYTAGVTKVNSLGKFPREGQDGLHIGAFHGSLDWDAGERSLPLKSESLLDAGYSYIALGHIHQHIKKTIGKGVAIYPGAIEHKSLSDSGVGNITVAEINGLSIDIKNISFPIRKHQRVEVDITPFESEEALTDALRSYTDPEMIAGISLKGIPQFNFDNDKLLRLLREGFFHLELINESKTINQSFIDSITKEHTIRGQFARRIIEKMNSATDSREKETYRLALLKGLEAFMGGK